MNQGGRKAGQQSLEGTRMIGPETRFSSFARVLPSA